ncbi:acetyltransferase [Leptolyngbya sp. NK1-12]|uniref:Acetyltransferase n=1 Tax=Leptolyngbya sp. NK1-12 TaxID=2547451 RepID=A0AA96WG99_9CYAN|nr:acetyltransferase [Leptolyngbya sp. NK1-12]WNZ24065.1 acetyltransferase [Leptolyngbya sp. NK1-12]
MLLQIKQNDTLIEVLDLEALISPTHSTIPGRIQSGQEEQDPEEFPKQDLVFPSGEALPKCWLDADYNLKSN